MPPRKPVVNRTRAWQKTPPRPAGGPYAERPSGWTRLKEFVKGWWVFLLAISGAVSGLTGYIVTIDKGRAERVAPLKAAISVLRREPSEAARRVTLDSLRTA